MKTIIIIILLSAVCLISNAQKHGTAFLVTYNNVTEFKGTKDFKLYTFTQVDSLATEVFDYPIDGKVLMGGTNRFVVENGNKTFYCELKYLNRRGNFILNKRVK